MARGVAEGLRAKLLTASGVITQTARPPGGGLDAYLAYERGVALVRQTTAVNQREAIAAFNEAIRLDPRYAAAYAQLAYAWTGLTAVYVAAPSTQAFAEAAAAAATALKLDATSSLAHRVHSFLLLSARMDWTGAAAEAQRALELAPHGRGAKSHHAY